MGVTAYILRTPRPMRKYYGKEAKIVSVVRQARSQKRITRRYPWHGYKFGMFQVGHPIPIPVTRTGFANW